MALTKVLIAVKTYPTLSAKYDELVCTAGFREDGTWIRVYPIPFRKLDYASQYKKYDWIELVHLGGSTKTESETTAGGFGEGTKILSLVLLRDYGAKKVIFSSQDWELEFYIDKVPHGSYRNEKDRGLFVKKRRKTNQVQAYLL